MRFPRVDISYVSGFFDGEGAIRVTAAPKSNLLTVTVVICQKSVEVFRATQALLNRIGIHSVIYKFASGMYTLDIIRVDEVVRFLRSVRCIVKKEQARAALDYLSGKVTGNALLQVLEAEHLAHRRKTSPLRTLGPRYPMTRAEALARSAINSKKARVEGNRVAFLLRLEGRVLSLPRVFTVRDVQRLMGVTKSRAQTMGVIMEREGLVSSHFERVPPRFRRKVFVRL